MASMYVWVIAGCGASRCGYRDGSRGVLRGSCAITLHLSVQGAQDSEGCVVRMTYDELA